MRVKICGITQPSQGREIARLGATALGFICVPQSPRYVTPAQIQAIARQLPPTVERIGVFANASLDAIERVSAEAELTGVQLHGTEPPEFCHQLRQRLPHLELIRALRVKAPASLTDARSYYPCADTLLLDAYHPRQLGGTGQTLNWSRLVGFEPPLPWFLAGGLTPDNVLEALSQLHPSGIDLSSGVERSPGDKDLASVARLFEALHQVSS